MQVVLRAPTARDLDVLPLSSSTSNIDYLMEAMDKAFESPIQSVSSEKEAPKPQLSTSGIERLTQLATPASGSGTLPVPSSLLKQLDELNDQLRGPTSRLVSQSDKGTNEYQTATSNAPRPNYVSTEAANVGYWINEVTASIQRLVHSQGLGKASGDAEMQHLASLSAAIPDLAAKLDNVELSSQRLASATHSTGVWRFGKLFQSVCSRNRRQPKQLSTRKPRDATLLVC